MPFIKRICHSLLGLLGFEIKRKKALKNLKDSTPSCLQTKKLIVEFIGVSGVGKSTIYSELLSKRNEKNWLTRQEFFKICNESDGMFEEYFLNYEELAKHKLEKIVQRECENWIRLKLCSYFFQVLRENRLIENMRNAHTLVIEEGLVHNFSEELLYLYESRRDKFREFLKYRVLVYCINTTENIMNNIISRKKEEGFFSGAHLGLSHDGIIQQTEESVRLKERLVAVLKKENIPVLILQTNDSVEGNAKRVKEFIDIHQTI
jgi:hypothetical protein